MSDFDTRQVGEVARLEEKIQALQQECAKYKVIAEKWEPKCASKMNLGEDHAGMVSMRFAGHVTNVVVSAESLASTDLTTLVSHFAERFASDLAVREFKKIIEVEVDNLSRNAKSIKSSGKW